MELTRYTPTGGTVTAFSGTTAPTTVAPPTTSSTTPAAGTTAKLQAVVPPQDQQIASLALTLDTSRNLPYFEIWVSQLVRSHGLQVTSWSPFTAGSNGQITYSAVISVLGTIRSSRLNEFEVIK